MANNIDTVEKAKVAGAYDAQYGQGAYTNASTVPTVSTAPVTTTSTVQPATNTKISTKDLGTPSLGTAPTLSTGSTTGNLGIAANTATSQIQTDATATPPVNPDRAALNSGLKNLIASIGGQADAANKIAKDEKLFEKKQKATAISTELDVIDKQYRDKINAIKKNPEGKFGGAIEQDVAKATDEYNNNRANVALVYKVAVEDYNGAAEIVNSKVSALKDQNAQALQAYNAYAQFLNNDLSDSEKLQVQSQLAIKQQQAKTTEDAYATYLSLAVQNKAPTSVLAAIDQAARQPGATAATIATAAGKYGIDPNAQLDQEYKRAQIDKIYGELNPVGGETVNIPGLGQVNGSAAALAQQLVSTGNLPSPADLNSANTTFAEVQRIAMAIPKGDGVILDKTTGLKSSTLSPTQEDGIIAAKDIVNRIDELKKVYNNVSLLSSNAARQEYFDKSAEIVDLIARARTGAVINDEEAAEYQKKIPLLFGLSGDSSFFGANRTSTGNQKLDDLKSSIEGKLKTSLESNNLVINGYSKVNIGGKDFVVGQTIDNGGRKQGRVLPDGTIYTPEDFSSAGNATASNRPQRNNNPLNIKASEFTKSFPGVVGIDNKAASDGGKFLTFNSPEAGFNAAKTLITSKNYANLSVDSALKRWSNNGYGAEIAPSLKGKKINQLTQSELDSLVQTMAKREGFYA